MREQGAGSGFLIECRKTQPHRMAAECHSPTAAALLAVEIEGNAILKWAGWRRKEEEEEGENIEDVKKTMASTLQHRAFAWVREQQQKNNIYI